MSARFTSLNRYSSWDGSQNTTLDADDILSALSEDLMEFGDLQQAMRYLMQRGMDTSDGSYIKGLRDLLSQLKAEKQQRLERFDLGGITSSSWAWTPGVPRCCSPARRCLALLPW